MNRLIYIEAPLTGGGYGVLYNGHTMLDPRGIAPDGWRIPELLDFTDLLDNIGGETLGGGLLKEAGLLHWDSPNVGATDYYGFSFRGNGYRIESFIDFKRTGSLWSNTLDFDDMYFRLDVNYINADAGIASSQIGVGHGIRLIKNDSVNSGLMQDQDGNIYQTVKIGNQVWMKSNLKVLHYLNGDPIQNITNSLLWVIASEGAYCDINNNPSNR